jgi:hypothetical protein
MLTPKQIRDAAKAFAVGDWVEWDGSHPSVPGYRPRMYRGQVVEVRADGLLCVVDNEWGARNGVAAYKARKIDAPEGY